MKLTTSMILWNLKYTHLVLCKSLWSITGLGIRKVPNLSPIPRQTSVEVAGFMNEFYQGVSGKCWSGAYRKWTCEISDLSWVVVLRCEWADWTTSALGMAIGMGGYGDPLPRTRQIFLYPSPTRHPQRV